MAYSTVDASESPKADKAPGVVSSLPTRRERLRAVLMVAGLLSLVAAFWIAVIRLVV